MTINFFPKNVPFMK